MSFSLSLTIKKILKDILDIKNEKIDASRLEGTIPVETLPPAALERVTVVKDDAARLALTKEKVQNGDTVKVSDTKKMYFVNDDTKLDTEAGYEEYVTGGAASAAIADKAKLAIDSEKLGGLTLENIRDEVKTYPANLQDQSVKNRHLAPDLKITADNIADNTITKNQLSLNAEDLDTYTKRESNEAIERAINALKSASPQVLDTLQKIESAINNDSNFATTISNALGGKVSKSGDTITGALKFENTSKSIETCLPSHYFHNLYNDNDRDTVYMHAFPSHPSPAKPTKFEFRTADGTQSDWTAHTLSSSGFSTPTIIFRGGSVGDFKRDTGDAISDNGGANVNIASWFGLGFYSTYEKKYTGSMNLRNGNWRTTGAMRADAGFEGNLHGIADMASKIKGNTLTFENGTQLWIE